CGMRAEECRRACHQRAVDDCKVQRDMMSFHPPAPGLLCRGSAEDREEILQLLPFERLAPATQFPRPPLEIAKRSLEIHDGSRREIASLAQRTFEQIVGK